MKILGVIAFVIVSLCYIADATDAENPTTRVFENLFSTDNCFQVPSFYRDFLNYRKPGNFFPYFYVNPGIEIANYYPRFWLTKRKRNTIFSGPLCFAIYNPQSEAIFPTSSTLVYGEKEAILLDAQFTIKDGKKLVQGIQAYKKQLKLIIITSGNPNHYFGLEPIVEAFPNVKIVSFPSVVNRINATKDGRRAFWAPRLKDGTPNKLFVPEPTNENRITIEGHSLELRSSDDYAAYIWIPSKKTILGGTGVFWGIHLTLVVTKTAESRASWRQVLQDMINLRPQQVIPGNYLGKVPPGDQAIRFTLEYMRNFENALLVNNYKNSTAVINAMKAAYPNLGLENSLDLSAKVLTGEGEEVSTDFKAGIIIADKNLVLQNIKQSTSGKYYCRAITEKGTLQSNHLSIDVENEKPFSQKSATSSRAPTTNSSATTTTSRTPALKTALTTSTKNPIPRLFQNLMSTERRFQVPSFNEDIFNYGKPSNLFYYFYVNPGTGIPKYDSKFKPTATVRNSNTIPLGSLCFAVYNPQNEAIFHVSSTLVYGENEAILLDAQFSIKDGKKIVQGIQAYKNKLKLIIITSGDPTFYFGLEPIVESFPNVKIVASPSVVNRVNATKDAKLAYWAPQLKDGAPNKIFVPEPTNETKFTIEGHSLEIRNMGSYAAYIWIPSKKTILGGSGVCWGIHLSTFGTLTAESRVPWRQVLREMIDLKPQQVIPGYYLGQMPPGDQAIRFTLEYLQTFENVLLANNYKNSTAVIDAMKAAYPNLGQEELLELSAKAITGET